MTAQTEEIPDFPCHRCGYDLRAHPPDGKCPECGTSVAESRRVGAVPLRPRWRESDPRWCRRMLAGVWILVLLPLMDVLRAFGWAFKLHVPTVLKYQSAVTTLDQTFLFNMDVYPPLIFCIGVVLLFSKERGRRRGPLDWTRRWGVVCSYVVLLLIAAMVLYLPALVLVGISAIFLSMPLKYQPGVTRLFAGVSSSYLRYGPEPKNVSLAVLVAFSSIAILLACVPLFNALRSSGARRVAAILLAPLAAFALLNLFQVLQYSTGHAISAADLSRYRVYFWPDFISELTAHWTGGKSSGTVLDVFAEILKWCTVLTIALWLTIARFIPTRKIRAPS